MLLFTWIVEVTETRSRQLEIETHAQVWVFHIND